MSAPELEMKTYSEAIQMLKRRNLRLKWARAGGLAAVGVLLLAGEVRLAGLAALVLGGSLLLLREPLSASRFYAAEKFILTDEQRRVRAVLGIDGEYSTLRLFSEGGQPVAELSGSSKYSAVLLRPETGEEATVLSWGDQGAMLTLKGAWGEAVTGAFHVPGVPDDLGKEWAPGPYVQVKDANGRERVFLYVTSGEFGGTSLDFRDGTGSAEASLHVGNGAASLELKEEDASRLLLGRCRFDPSARLVLYDKNGNIMWQAP